MTKLIAIDIDGTLRHSDGTISEYFKQVLNNIQSLGNIVVLCTARPRYHSIKVNSEIVGSNYIICLSGTEIYDQKLDKAIYEKRLNKEEISGLYKYAKENDVRIMFSSDDKEYVTNFTSNDDQILINEKDEKLLLNSYIKACMVIDKDKLAINRFKEYATKMYDSNIIVDSNINDEAFLVIVPGDASKGNALKFLTNYLGLVKEDVISFGNDENDISMFLESGEAVAVANGTEELLKVANEIVESNDDDGVAKYLSRKFLR